jgi:chromosome segregation ATPase
MTSPAHVTVALALTAGLLGACASGGDDRTVAQLQEDLDVQAEAQGALRDRIAELEDALATAAAAEGDETGRLEDRIEEVAGRIGDLSRQLGAAETAREDQQAEDLAALSSLETAVSELRAELERLDTELVKLREDHELLIRRFEDHTH